MYTNLREPVKELLPLEVHPEILKDLRRQGKALDEIVAMGTHLLKWEITASSPKGGDALVVTSLLRRALEVLDGAALLIENASITPAKALARLIIEISIQCQYFLKDPAEINKKALHFSIMEDFYTLLDLELMRKKTYFQKDWTEIDKEIEEFTNKINGPFYKEIETEFENCIYTIASLKKGPKIRKKTPDKWFTMSGGGDSFTKLFSKLDRKQRHWETYTVLSDTIHTARSLNAALYSDKGARNKIRIIRDPAGAKDLVRILVAIVLELYSWIIRRLTNDQRQIYLINLEEWRKEYPDLYMKQIF